MTRNSNPRENFLQLVRAHEVDDEEAIHRISEQLRASGQPLRLVLNLV